MTTAADRRIAGHAWIMLVDAFDRLMSDFDDNAARRQFHQARRDLHDFGGLTTAELETTTARALDSARANR